MGLMSSSDWSSDVCSSDLLAQRMSDRAVRILSASNAGELLPRIARDRDHVECRMCAYANRCWSLPQ
jgi:hypothetical protein